MNIGLFPAPEPAPPGLSTGLAGQHEITAPTQKVKWTRRAATSRVDCQECAMLQHETRGSYGPRRRAKWRRTTCLGAHLDLCTAHMQAWKARDALRQGGD